MTSPLILITGVTGFIGSHTALAALRSNYRLRITIRREHQSQMLQRTFGNFEEQVEFVVIPDLEIPGCFDAALRDVTYVLHLASPMAGREGSLIDPTRKGTLSVLESAMKTSSIQKVVIMQSVASFLPLENLKGDFTVTESNNIDFSIDSFQIDQHDGIVRYHAAKLAAYQATLDFINTRNPRYDVVTLHPTYVFGRSLLQNSAAEISGSNALLFSALMTGNESSSIYWGQYLGVHISDVVDAQMAVLHKEIPSGSAFLLSGKPRPWEDVYDFVTKEYPELDIKLLPKSWTNWSLDVRKAENELGLNFHSMEDQVKEVIDQQLTFQGDCV
ncbi:flavonol reductase [Aspergillus coremiiformis]|uniref:Flavonol reductase n=1 Tax=Aspergillus coremiiformis TaxID=138285 RepID=A0A5N6ZBA4_9EURO|nr:flavonol reductase [Aspergillus coremiiformis]